MGLLRCFCDADTILGSWIPAIPRQSLTGAGSAGMTCVYHRFAKDPETNIELNSFKSGKNRTLGVINKMRKRLNSAG